MKSSCSSLFSLSEHKRFYELDDLIVERALSLAPSLRSLWRCEELADSGPPQASDHSVQSSCAERERERESERGRERLKCESGV